MSQAISLVPSIRKDIKADLASCQVGSRQTKARVKERLQKAGLELSSRG
jgi:hypothetical protein